MKDSARLSGLAAILLGTGAGVDDILVEAFGVGRIADAELELEAEDDMMRGQEGRQKPGRKSRPGLFEGKLQFRSDVTVLCLR